MPTRNALTRLAPAKINLTLAVLGRRDDGFHDIESWVVPIDLCDELVFAPARELTLTAGEGSYSVPLDESNLIWRAATIFAKEAGIEPRVAITLHKHIPIGAGLGGGSSDAATTLLALNDRWELHWPIARLTPLAAKLGSDVPLFLERKPVVIRGRGERVEYLRSIPRAWIALIIPPFSVSTPSVYARWSAFSNRTAHILRTAARPWDDDYLNPESLMPQLFNDLEPAAFDVEPRLRALHHKLAGFHDKQVRMTGSGSGLFTLFIDDVKARTWSESARIMLGPGFSIYVVSIGTSE